jgi:D-3-phosphoglycerate dehydrogenase
MGSYQVVVIPQIFASFEEEKRVFQGLNVELKPRDCLSKDEVKIAVQEADGLLLHHIPQIDAEIISAMRRCRVISRYGVGYHNIDVEAATRAGIWVARVPQYGAEENVTDQALSLLLACIRAVNFKDRRIREGGWNLHRERKSYRIKGKILGIIGYGRIGQSFHRKVSGFELKKVLVYDPYIKPQYIRRGNGIPVDKDTLLREADYITVHVPLNEETRHMIADSEFKAMKPTAILVNTSVGSVVAEHSLCQALRKRRIQSAGIDVFENEPLPANSCLLGLDNVVLSDHTGYYSEESLAELKTKAARNIAAVFQGNKPLYPVNHL